LADEPVARGQLLGTPQKIGTYVVSGLLSRLADGWVERQLLKETFSPVCAVTAWHFEYATVGGHGEPTTASAALIVPVGSHWRCQGPRPIVLYAHGKRDYKFYNIADLNNGGNYEGLLLALACAGRGYIVVAPNYAGYDTSTLPYHAYLNADQQSKDMIDALSAARAWLPAAGSADAGKLFVTGYSEGGYVAMATHRALEAAGQPVTASVPMSGPYALSAFGDAVFLGQVDAGAPAQLVMLATSYQHSYGNLYATPNEVFEDKYAAGIDSLLPNAVGSGTLVSQGLLPESALFNSNPPTPGLAAFTPATSPADLAGVFAMGFGADDLVRNSYRLSYLEDAVADPDGGYPNTTTGLPPASPTNAFRLDLKNNDLRTWSPTAPMLICGGDEDPVVFYFNTQLMQAYWAVNAPESTVTFLDVDAAVGSGDPYKHIKEGFHAAKAAVAVAAVVGGASDGGRSAVLENYHGSLVPAFCLQAARAFFDAH
jgi:dienelactone hydrolase